MDRRAFNGALMGALASTFAPGILSSSRAASDAAALSAVSDGNLVLPVRFALPEVDEADIAALGIPALSPSGELRPPCNLALYRSGDRLVLFDAGSGPNFQPTAGKLLESLETAGVAPGDITDVIFTHAHPDHLWGVVDDFDEVLFPEATFHMSQTEWDFWRADATLGAMPEDRKVFVVGARSRFDAIEDRTKRFASGAEVAAGIEAFGTPGHTPGHMAFVVHGLDEPVLVVGDALSNDPVSFARPDWHWGADQEPAEGAATRLKLLDRLASEKLRLVGFHLPGDGMGRVEREGAAYRFVREA